jgi:hypothetical protein
VVLAPGAEKTATGVSLTALTERVNSDGAIPPGRKCFLLMDFGNQKSSHYPLGEQQCSIIEWWMSNACYSTKASGVLNIL